MFWKLLKVSLDIVAMLTISLRQKDKTEVIAPSQKKFNTLRILCSSFIVKKEVINFQFLPYLSAVLET